MSSQSTPRITTATTSGTVAAGAREVEFILSADFTGTILGAAYDGATDYSVPFKAAEDAGGGLKEIAYVVTTGTLRIRKILP